MSRHRTWGLLAWVAAVGCGGNTAHHEPDNGVTKPSGASGTPTSSSGTSGATSSNRAGTSSTDPGRAGGASLAGDASVTVGGATSEDPCLGITPACQPGESICEPVTGRLTTCSDCGEPLPAEGEACVRLLASDKESNNFCVVKSNSHLECWPGWGETDKSVVSGDVVELLLPDDAATQRPIKPCLRERSGNYSCSGAGAGCKVALGDAGACAVCDGKLYCDPQITVPDALNESLIDVSITDSSAFLLSSRGVELPGVPARLPGPWRSASAQLLVDHQSAGCVVSERHELSCWLTLLEPLRPPSWKNTYRKVVPTTLPHACALDDARQLRCGDIFVDTTPQPVGPADVLNFAASTSMVCSLSVTGKVSCWRIGQALEAVEVPAGW
ncbi:MAG TPA: hypothetical protein VHP33_24630 [Polyangiaceae bacterium]|nr:hypothetical protein [Polyangiaceae bacterium]